LGPSAWVCNSSRRVSTAGSAASQTPSDVRSWRARPGASSTRRARRVFHYEGPDGRSNAVRGLGRGSSRPRCAALLLTRVRGQSVFACRWMRAISSHKGSLTAARQLSRHCWVEGHLVTLPDHAGASRAMRGMMRRRVKVSHVSSRSTACGRQVSARAHVEEAAIGTLHSVRMRAPSRCTRSRPAERGRPLAPGGLRCKPGQVPPVPPWSISVPGTAQLAVIFLGRLGTPEGLGRGARPPAVRHRLTGAQSGGGTHATAGSPIPSVRPPRGARTAALGRTTYRKVERGWGPGSRSGAVRFGWEHGRPLRQGLIYFHGASQWGRCILGKSLHGPTYLFRVGLHRCLRGVPVGGVLRGMSRLR